MMDLLASRPRTTREISDAVKSRSKPVNHLIDLEVYFKTADFVGLQASVYRQEENWQERFRVLMAYCSLVVETIARHRDWTKDSSGAHKKKAATCLAYEAEAAACMDEMELLKPKVNAEAEAWREKTPPQAPATKPPGIENPAGTPAKPGDAEVNISNISPLETFTDGDWDLLSATPAQLDMAAQRRASATAAGMTSSSTKTTPPRYTPNAEYVGANVASAETTSRHALVASGVSNITGQSARQPGSYAPGGTYPSVDSMRTAVPRITRDASARPPPPPGPAPAKPSAPPLPPPAPLPPPPPAPYVTPSAIVTSAASRDFTPQRMQNVPAPDFAKEDHNRLDTRLALYGLKEKKVRGDGNCQFRALADQLFSDQERHAEIRGAVVDQLQRDADAYSVFVGEDYGSYVRDMSRQTTWGDHITLQAAADLYGVSMCVISSYKDNFVIEIQPKLKRSERVLWISFWAEVHYNSIYHINAKI